MSFKKRGLGRGLEALLVASGSGETEAGEQSQSKNDLREIPVDLIQRAPERFLIKTLSFQMDFIKEQHSWN